MSNSSRCGLLVSHFCLLILFESSQYGNAVQDDLWNAFDKQAQLDHVFLPTNVKTIMDTWTLKMGNCFSFTTKR